MREKVKYIMLILFAFLFIYFPPILFVHTLHILGAISWSIIICNFNSFSIFFKQGKYIKEIFFSFFMIWYLLTILFFNNGNNYFVGYVFIVLILEILPISFVIVYFLEKNKNKINFLDFIFHVGLLQSFFSILAFLIPEFQMMVINSMLAYGYDSIIIRLSQNRMFGLSYTFPYSMPIVQGILACLSIYFGINKNIKYFIFTPFLMFSGIINARICIVIILIGTFLIIIDLVHKNPKGIYKTIFIVLVFTFLINSVADLINDRLPESYLWLAEGFSDLFDLLFYGDTSGSYSSYATNSDNYLMPDGFHLIFGTSDEVMRGNLSYQSDIGYVNDIWKGGIVYVVLVYSYLLNKLINIRKILNKKEFNGTMLALFILLVMIFSNIKGIIYSVNEFINLFYLTYVYIMCSSD